MALVHGNFVPLATPFTDDGRSLSEVRLARQVRYWMNEGARGFYLNGETGEFLTVISSERKAVLELVHRECQGSLPLLVNVSSLSTALSLDLAQHAGRHGATAAFVTPPYFGRYTQPELKKHLHAVGSLAGLPVVIADLANALEPGYEAEFSTLSQVEFANGTTYDEWKSDAASVHAIATLSHLFPDTDRGVLGKAYLTYGPAVLIKAGFERKGIDLGTPRSPKAVLDAKELTELLQLAA